MIVLAVNAASERWLKVEVPFKDWWQSLKNGTFFELCPWISVLDARWPPPRATWFRYILQHWIHQKSSRLLIWLRWPPVVAPPLPIPTKFIAEQLWFRGRRQQHPIPFGMAAPIITSFLGLLLLHLCRIVISVREVVAELVKCWRSSALQFKKKISLISRCVSSGCARSFIFQRQITRGGEVL